MAVPFALTKLPSVVPVEEAAAAAAAAAALVVVEATILEAEVVIVVEEVDIVCAGPAYRQISANMPRRRWRRLRWWT